MRTLAIIPARGGSKRLPGKNVRLFKGIPLVAWSVRFAKRYPRFDRVMVSTDAQDIADIACSEGLEVPSLRPLHLATDTALTVDVVLDALDSESKKGRRYDRLALLQPTSPMRLASRWDVAYAHLDTGRYDAAIGVAPVKTHPFHAFNLNETAQLTPFHDAAGLRLRGQDLPPAVAVAGNLYLIEVDALRTGRTFFPARSAGVLCDQPFESADIDDELDWLVAETIATIYGIEP